jgi:hypothetical protein
MFEKTSCFHCGCKVKGSLNFVPHLKEKLGWVFIGDKAYCNRHREKGKK